MSGLPGHIVAEPAAPGARRLQLSLASLFFWTAMGAAWFVLFRFHVGLGVLGAVVGLPPLVRTLWHMHRAGEAKPWPIERQYVFFVDSFALTVVALAVCGFLFATVAVLTSVIAMFLLPTGSAFILGALLGTATAAPALCVVVRDHW
jgi:hypothetical protein